MRLPPGTAPDAAFTEAAHAEEVCRACGIRLDARLHSGRIVDVYRARLIAEPRVLVAAKITRPQWRGHAGAIRLVAREYHALKAVEHPHLVRALGFAERGGIAALVTEFLPGGDLVPLAGEPPERWMPAVRAVVAALAALHAAGFVHGDLKARNVLFDGSGAAKLIDLGSARAIGAARTAGGRTRAHVPLRFALPAASPVEDVYALAVLLYELITGRLPFGPEPAAWSEPAPIEPGVSCGLEALAARVIATLRAEKPRETGTLIEFADVLESVHGEAVEPA